MNDMFKKIKLLFVLACLLATSCAIDYDYVKIRNDIRSNIDINNKEKAIQIVNDEKFYSDGNSILLKKLEQGTVQYMAGNYYQALKYFDEAEDIAESLYTVKISSKLKSVVSDNFDDYSGEKYEKSLIYFYKSLLNYNLYLSGKYENHNHKDNKTTTIEKTLSADERLKHLRMARSNIMKWESLLNSYKNESKHIVDYNLDLLEKIWGAFIFEQNGSPIDIDRALNMYKSAKTILKNNYSIYPAFNSKYKDVLNNKKYDAKFVENTAFFHNTDSFINEKIKQLSLKNDKKDNFVVLLNEKYITLKQGKTVNIPMELALFVGQPDEFFIFLNSIVKINSKDNLPYFKIQLPYLEKYDMGNSFVAEIYDNNKNKINEFNINLIEPVSDILYTNFENEKTILYTKITAEVLLKYALALKSSYEVYKTSLESSNNSMIAMSVATLSYIGAEKLITNYNKPDLRQWAMLPNTIRFGSISLDNGSYTLKIKKVNKTATSYIYNKDIDIKNGETTFVDVNF